MRTLLVASVTLALAGCPSPRASSQPSTTPVVAAVTSAPDAAAPAPDAVAPDAPPDVPAPDAPAAPDDAPPSPFEALVRAAAAGRVPMTDAVDARAGVVTARFLEPTPDGRQGERATRRRLCGAALTRGLPALQSDLAAAVRQADDGAGMQCGDDGCRVPGMEYQPSWVIRVGATAAGPRVALVAQVSEAALPDEWQARASAHLQGAAALPPCR